MPGEGFGTVERVEGKWVDSYACPVAVAKRMLGGLIEMRWKEDELQPAREKAGRRDAAARRGRERVRDGKRLTWS